MNAPSNSRTGQRNWTIGFGVWMMLSVLSSGCRLATHNVPSEAELREARTHYPAHWWAEVTKENAPAWEIFPQQAKPGEVILSKRNELGLL